MLVNVTFCSNGIFKTTFLLFKSIYTLLHISKSLVNNNPYVKFK